MDVYEVRADHILITDLEGTIPLTDMVIGISIRILPTSGEPDLVFGINDPGKVPLNVNDNPATYGGFHIGTVPCIYRGEIKYKFASATTPKGLIILTRMVPAPVQGLEIFESCK